MLTLLLVFLFLNPIVDSHGITCEISGVHIEKQMTYVQVTYESGKWGVYFLANTETPETIVQKGVLLDEKTGLKLFPLSDTWKYVKQKEYTSYAKSP